MNDNRNDIAHPPQWPLRFLRSFCPEYLLEEIEGDLFQKFESDVEELGLKKAKRKLTWNVIRYFRPGIVLRNSYSFKLNQIDMLKSYLNISMRSLLKNKGFSFINISGLAVGLAAFLLILQYVKFERSYENFHEKADNIYRVTLDLYNGSEFIVTDCETYAPVGPMLKAEMPEVIDFVRMFSADGIHVLSKDFIKVILVATVLALPIAYILMDSWLTNYATRIELNPFVFIFPLLGILLVAIVTVSFQTIKVAGINPVDTLKE